MHSTGDIVTGLIVIIILLGIYLLPTIIAFSRGHASKLAIALINIFLGWLLLSWFIALIWSLADSGRGNHVVINNVNNPYDRSREFDSKSNNLSNADFELLAEKTAEKLAYRKNSEPAQGSAIRIIDPPRTENTIKSACLLFSEFVDSSDKLYGQCGHKM